MIAQDDNLNRDVSSVNVTDDREAYPIKNTQMTLKLGTYLHNGRYTIKRVLGQGNSWITYIATLNIVSELGSFPTDTNVVVKEFFMRNVNGRKDNRVTTGSDGHLFHRRKELFMSDIGALSKHNHHPDYLPIIDIFEENNTSYFVMKYIEGAYPESQCQSTEELQEGLKPDPQYATNNHFPRNTVSFLIECPDSSLIYYYRGTVYKEQGTGFQRKTHGNKTLNELRDLFESHFAESEKLSLKQFIERFGGTILIANTVIASFLEEADYYSLLSYICNNRIKASRLTAESRYVARYLAKQSEIEQLQTEEISEKVHTLRYDNTEIKFELGEGVCEIKEGIGLEWLPDRPEKEKNHVILSSDNLRDMLLWGLLSCLRIQVLREKNSEILLIDSFPYEIGFGPKWGKMVPLLIEAGLTIPTRKADTFDFVGTDTIAVRIGKLEYLINISEDFGYMPRYVECCAEIGSDLRYLKFSVKDSETGKSHSYQLKDLGTPSSIEDFT